MGGGRKKYIKIIGYSLFAFVSGFLLIIFVFNREPMPPDINYPGEGNTAYTETTGASEAIENEENDKKDEEDDEEPHHNETAPVPEPLPRTIRPEFLRLREEYNNEHIIGHLIIPGTDIDYLVVQTGDNIFYLTHDLRGQPDRGGTIFLDYENRLSRPDRNTILYGHNMAAGTHFATMTRFRDGDFFRENRYIIFNTIYEDTVWEIFAFYSTDISFPYIQVIFPGADAFERLLTGIKALSWHDAGIPVTAGDRILTLSTCTTTGRDIRYVLNARLIQ
jgi:sortase B